MDNIKIIRAFPEDVNSLKDIGILTFKETFEKDNSLENMEMYLKSSFNIDALREELSNVNSEFFFALINHQIIGYLKLNHGHAQTEIKDISAIEIERIYVRNKFQRLKVGHQFIKEAIEIAQKNNAKYIWLGVWEKNLKAIAFYKKYGFFEFDRHVFKLGNDIQTDILMRLNLTAEN